MGNREIRGAAEHRADLGLFLWPRRAAGAVLPVWRGGDRHRDLPVPRAVPDRLVRRGAGAARGQRAGLLAAAPRSLERPGEPSVHRRRAGAGRSEEHTSELQSLMRISYAVFCLKKNNITTNTHTESTNTTI